MCERFRCCLLGLVLVTLYLGVVVAPALAQPTQVMSGVVTDENGNPIPGVLVTAWNEATELQDRSETERLEQTTDDRGRYSMIVGSGTGQWTLTAVADGYQPEMTSLAVRVGGNSTDFTLIRIRHALELALGEEALEGHDPEVVQKEIRVAHDLLDNEQYDQALAAYEALVAKVPALTDLYVQIGHSYRGKEEYDKAITAYEEVLKNDPENAQAQAGIDRANLEANLEAGNFEAAEATLAETASSLDAPREDLYNMGELEFAKGAIDEAAGWYEKAHMRAPNWGKPLFKLALVALNKGDTETAVTYFQQVVDVDPDSEEGTQASLILQQLQP